MSEDLKEYVERRWIARAGLVLLLGALALLIHLPRSVNNWLQTLSSQTALAVSVVGIGVLTMAVGGLVLQWAGWPCPRCQRNFVLAQSLGAAITLGVIFAKLVCGTRCAHCRAQLQ